MAEPSTRKPLDDACDGSIFCIVQGHVRTARSPNGSRRRITHVSLTIGQRKTLAERRRAAGRG